MISRLVLRETKRFEPTLSAFLGLSSTDELICVRSKVLPGDSVAAVAVSWSLMGLGLARVVLVLVDSEKLRRSSLIVDYLSNLIGLCSTILLSIS